MTEDVLFRTLPGGNTRGELLHRGQPVSRVEIRPFVLRYGVATVRAAYIGDVATAEAWHGRGSPAA